MDKDPNMTPPSPTPDNDNPGYFNAPPRDSSAYFAPMIDERPPVGTGFAVASLILSIFSVVCCCTGPIALIPACLAILFAIVDRVRAKSFRGLAVTGLIIGIIGLIVSAYMTAMFIQGFSIYTQLLNDPEFQKLVQSGDAQAIQDYINNYYPSVTNYYSSVTLTS